MLGLNEVLPKASRRKAKYTLYADPPNRTLSDKFADSANHTLGSVDISP